MNQVVAGPLKRSQASWYNSEVVTPCSSYIKTTFPKKELTLVLEPQKLILYQEEAIEGLYDNNTFWNSDIEDFI